MASFCKISRELQGSNTKSFGSRNSLILDEDDSITLFSKVKPSLQSNIETEGIKLRDDEKSYWDSLLDKMSDFDLDGFKEYLTDLEKESD